MSKQFPRLYEKRAKIAKAFRSQPLHSFVYVCLSIFVNRVMQKFRNLEYEYQDSSLRILPPAGPASGQAITIIIPFRDKADILKRCLENLFSKTAYPNYRIALVDNGSVEHETLEYLDLVRKNRSVVILRYDKPFNYSAMHNWVMGFIKTDFVLFLNNDTEVISRNWLTSMAARLEENGVGAVGALLLFPDGKVQHAGVGIYPEVATHLYEGEDPEGTESDKINQSRQVYAVTGACLLTKKSLYYDAGGMDEVNLPVNFNDIDYCLCLRSLGYSVVFEPAARLYHYESYSRGKAWSDSVRYRAYLAERKFFWKKWRQYVNSMIS